MTRQKTLRLPNDRIRNLAPELGACFATREITIHGARVGYMYREAPAEMDDSGWRFMAGNETQDYMDQPENTSVIDVNVIADCDPEIIPLLLAPEGSAFERVNGSGPFRPCAPPGEPDREPASPE
jgi:hypothetical protein